LTLPGTFTVSMSRLTRIDRTDPSTLLGHICATLKRTSRGSRRFGRASD
jgi:hypothetical protein